jgi:hypothetical protein
MVEFREMEDVVGVSRFPHDRHAGDLAPGIEL